MLFLVCGHICLATGTIGIIVPILPTTPFILLACFCYERGSPRFHHALLENKYFGPLITEWKKFGSIPVRAKIIAVAMIVCSIGWVVYAAPILMVKIGVGVVGVCVSAYILTRPSRHT